MNSFFIISVVVFLVVLFFCYLGIFLFLKEKIRRIEFFVVDIFLQKISKVPALIEVMRPYVIDEKKSFELMTRLHSEAIIHEYTHIPVIMEHNARINDQYAFLMRLSMAIPELQKNSYFIYIRDYIIDYDRHMRGNLPEYNRLIKNWNRFIYIKNITIIGYLLPGREKVEL